MLSKIKINNYYNQQNQLKKRERERSYSVCPNSLNIHTKATMPGLPITNGAQSIMIIVSIGHP